MARGLYLSGGVLFLLILECHEEGMFANVDVINGLVKAVTGKSFMAKRSDASYYLGCNRSVIASIPFYKASTRDAYDQMVKGQYQEALKRMKAFTDKFMPLNQEWFINAIVDLMSQDCEEDFGDDTELYISSDGIPMKKSEAIMQDEFSLPSFMVGLVHFIVFHRGDKNKYGADTITAISTKGGRGRKYSGSLGQENGRTICVNCNVPEVAMKKASQDETVKPDDYIMKLHVSEEARKAPQDARVGQSEYFVKFRDDVDNLLKYCVDKDPSAEMVRLTLADEIQEILRRWQFDVRKIVNQEEQALVYEVMETFAEYGTYISDTYLRYNENSGMLIFRNGSIEEGERLRKELRPNTIRLREKLAMLYRKLWPAHQIDCEEEVMDYFAEFRDDVSDLLEYCMTNNPTAGPIRSSLRYEIEDFLREWQNKINLIICKEEWDVASKIVKRLSDYAPYLSDKYMRIEGDELVVRKETEKEEQRFLEKMRPDITRLIRKFKKSYQTLWELRCEYAEVEVMEESPHQSESVTYIDKQVNIGHNEVKNFAINSSTVTFNL